MLNRLLQPLRINKNLSSIYYMRNRGLVEKESRINLRRVISCTQYQTLVCDNSKYRY